MVKDVLVDVQLDAGRKFLQALVRSGINVTTAFWTPFYEDGPWCLYIGSSSVNKERIGDAYRIAYACLREMGDIAVRPNDFRLLPFSDPVIQDAITFRDRHPMATAARFGPRQFGDVFLEEGYIYPRNIGPLTPPEVLEAITGMMSRSGFQQPVQLTLRDGSRIRGLPVGVQVRAPGQFQVDVMDAGTNLVRSVQAHDVENIQYEPEPSLLPQC